MHKVIESKSSSCGVEYYRFTGEGESELYVDISIDGIGWMIFKVQHEEDGTSWLQLEDMNDGEYLVLPKEPPALQLVNATT